MAPPGSRVAPSAGGAPGVAVTAYMGVESSRILTPSNGLSVELMRDSDSVEYYLLNSISITVVPEPVRIIFGLAGSLSLLAHRPSRTLGRDSSCEQSAAARRAKDGHPQPEV